MTEMIENQKQLIQSSEDRFENELKEASRFKESLKVQTGHVSELENELQRVRKMLDDHIARLKTREEEATSLHANNRKLIEELGYFKNETNRDQGSHAQIIKERDYLVKQLNEYVAREEFIKELYNRQQENKDDRHKVILEKEQTISNLEKKLSEQNQQLEILIVELDKEQETRRSQMDKLHEASETKIKVHFNFILLNNKRNFYKKMMT